MNNLKHVHHYILTLFLVFVFSGLINFNFTFGQESSEEGEIRLWIQNYDQAALMTVDLYNFKFERIHSTTSQSPLVKFGSLDMGNIYFLILEYQKTIYSIEVDLTTPFKEISIRLDDQSGIESDIQIEFDHILINYDKKNIIISEIVEFRNFGDRVISFVKMHLPETYTDLNSDRCCIKIETNDDSFYLSPIKIKPNQTRTIELSYVIESNSRDYNYSRKSFYNTTGLLIIVNEDNTRIIVPEDLIFRDIQKINEKSFEQYTASGIDFNKEIILKISRFEESALEQVWSYFEEFSLSIYRTLSIYYMWIIIGTIAFVTLGLFTYNFIVRAPTISRKEGINSSIKENMYSKISENFKFENEERNN